MKTEDISSLLSSALKFHHEGLLDQADEVYKDILKIDKKNFFANHLLGEVYQLKFKHSHDVDLINRSIKCFKESLESNPHSADTYIKLGLSLLWLDKIDEADKCFKQSYSVVTSEPTFLKNDLNRLNNKQAIEAMIKHEFEQLTYIDGDPDGIRNTKFSSEYYNFLKAQYKKIQEGRFESKEINHEMRLKLLKQLYNKPPKINLEHYINVKNDIAQIELDYVSSSPEIIVIDNFLSEEALEAIQKFCLSSNIFKHPYKNGYLGAFLEKGLSNQFVLKLTQNLKNTFKKIFNNLYLTEAWIYKYDSEQNGINIHADEAKVNVNFWITPNESNLNQESGGLIIWDKIPDKNWVFEDYNYIENTSKIKNMLKKNNAKKIKIPYKENRAVIFNSQLFHCTDKYTFKNDFINRRLNVTLLYG